MRHYRVWFQKVDESGEPAGHEEAVLCRFHLRDYKPLASDAEPSTNDPCEDCV